MSAAPRFIGRFIVAAGCTLAVALTAGCAPVAPSVTARDVLFERTSAIEAESRARFETFLAENGDRLIELNLPQPSFRGVVAREQWGESVVDCVESLDSEVGVSSQAGGFDENYVGVPDTDIRVSRQTGGFSINYFGMPDGAYERVRWTIESCMVQYGVPAALPPPRGPIEAEWMLQDATQRLLPCWRSLGYSAVPLPSADALRHGAVCPATAVELQRQLERLAGQG